MHRVYVNDNAEQDIQKNVSECQIVISVTRKCIIEEIRYGKREKVNNNICKSIMEVNIIENILIEYPKRKEKESKVIHVNGNVSMNRKIINPTIEKI